jgi:hypothetical protein
MFSYIFVARFYSKTCTCFFLFLNIKLDIFVSFCLISSLNSSKNSDRNKVFFCPLDFCMMIVEHFYTIEY